MPRRVGIVERDAPWDLLQLLPAQGVVIGSHLVRILSSQTRSGPTDSPNLHRRKMTPKLYPCCSFVHLCGTCFGAKAGQVRARTLPRPFAANSHSGEFHEGCNWVAPPIK